VDDLEKQRIERGSVEEINQVVGKIEGVCADIASTVKAADPAVLGANIKAAEKMHAAGLPCWWGQMLGTVLAAGIIAAGKDDVSTYVNTLIDILDAGEGVLKNG